MMQSEKTMYYMNPVICHSGKHKSIETVKGSVAIRSSVGRIKGWIGEIYGALLGCQNYSIKYCNDNYRCYAFFTSIEFYSILGLNICKKINFYDMERFQEL